MSERETQESQQEPQEDSGLQTPQPDQPIPTEEERPVDETNDESDDQSGDEGGDQSDDQSDDQSGGEGGDAEYA